MALEHNRVLRWSGTCSPTNSLRGPSSSVLYVLRVLLDFDRQLLLYVFMRVREHERLHAIFVPVFLRSLPLVLKCLREWNRMSIRYNAGTKTALLLHAGRSLRSHQLSTMHQPKVR